MDVSGNTLFVQLLTSSLLKKPQTRSEAERLYAYISVQLAAYVVSELPASEQRAFHEAHWLAQKLITRRTSIPFNSTITYLATTDSLIVTNTSTMAYHASLTGPTGAEISWASTISSCK
jgi:hypothetical protein